MAEQDTKSTALMPKTIELTPPPGWFVFGSHVDQPVQLEFYGEQFTEDGMPCWERPLSSSSSLTTVEQLDALPVGTVIRSQAGSVWVIDSDITDGTELRYNGNDSEYFQSKSVLGLHGPVQVIYRPVVAQTSENARSRPGPDRQSEDEVFLEKKTIQHAYFGGIGGDVAKLVITREAWHDLGESDTLTVAVRTACIRT